MSILHRGWIALLAALAIGFAASAGAAEVAPPQNVITLSAQASTEVARDWLSITLAVTREGSEAAEVQTQLRQALDASLAEARKAARPGQVEVHTGQFSVFPRYAPKGGINGWQGSAELVVEGRDMAALSALAGRLTQLVVTRVTQSLSREAREKVEADVAAQAIGRFRARAEAYAKQFGFSGYTVREVAVNGGEPVPVPLPVARMSALAAGAQAAGEPQPVEAGNATVMVTVSGSVQMTR
jgi:predicted secreted protein